MSNMSYNAAISACEKGKQWEGALQLLQEMVCQALTPNVVSYSAAGRFSNAPPGPMG